MDQEIIVYKLGQLETKQDAMIDTLKQNTASNEKLFEQITETLKNHERRLNKLDLQKSFVHGVLWLIAGIASLVAFFKDKIPWLN
jgi:hypothetical protein